MKIKEAIVVEGVYDKIRLDSVVSALVVTTDGFDVINNTEKLDYIRKLAAECGIVILTDSDRAGFLIRNFIKGAVNVGKVLNAFIPDIVGKEKRKKKPSKEGFLGVEGVSGEVIVRALLVAGCTVDGEINVQSAGITSTDLFCDGVTGGKNSVAVRKKLTAKMGLPVRISSKELLKAINLFLTRKEYEELVNEANAERNDNI